MASAAREPASCRADSATRDEPAPAARRPCRQQRRRHSASRARRRITLAVAGLDALLDRLATQRIEYEPIETYSIGVRHVKAPDPDGNAIAFAEPPDAGEAPDRLDAWRRQA